jgi:hypothetical protein
MMRIIGNSISEAINWTQDQLLTTRPLAERTLFFMLADHRVAQTKFGFILVEAKDNDNEEMKKTHQRLKMQHRPRSGLMEKKVNVKNMHQLERHLAGDPTQRDRINNLHEVQSKMHQDIDAEEKDSDALS